LKYSGAAKQLLLLATQLPRERIEPLVAVLGMNGPWAEELRRASVPHEWLGWKRLYDAKPFLRLRELGRSFEPDVIQALGIPALRAIAFTGTRGKSRLVVS